MGRLKTPDELGTPEVVCNECGRQAPGREFKDSISAGGWWTCCVRLSPDIPRPT